jgi:FkbM family methyltransferase
LSLPAVAQPLTGLRFVWEHPLTRRSRLQGIWRYLTWQLRCHLQPAERAIPWVNGSSLLVAPGLTGVTGNLYCGLHEWPDMALLLHLLRPQDGFADIGSNAGSYTVLASAAVGCRTEAFEPVPSSCAWLQRQLDLNGIAGRVTVHRLALGASAGSLRFSVDQGPMNRVVGDVYSGATQMVPVLPIDAIPALRQTCCWKLDVEGHEPAVLAGAARTLSAAPPAVILCEDRSPPVTECLSAAGFRSCVYDPWSRRLNPGAAPPGCNQLWIRDLAWARKRLRSAPAFTVLGQRI